MPGPNGLTKSACATKGSSPAAGLTTCLPSATRWWRSSPKGCTRDRRAEAVNLYNLRRAEQATAPLFFCARGNSRRIKKQRGAVALESVTQSAVKGRSSPPVAEGAERQLSQGWGNRIPLTHLIFVRQPPALL